MKPGKLRQLGVDVTGATMKPVDGDAKLLYFEGDMVRKLPLIWCAAFGFAISSPAEDASKDNEIDFSRDIRPILSDQCFVCHGPDEKHRKAKLRLDTREGATKDNGGTHAIDLENPENSELLFRILSDDEDEVMPPPDSIKQLTAEQKELLKKWIAMGAPWEDHWAFVPPHAQGEKTIDEFIAARLKAAGLDFSPEAEPHMLIRRVTFDLTGLPPTPAEVNEFLEAVKKQGSEKAYEALVDRLLKSPHYGERMALAWMDAARYGDSSVMHADGPRDMWPWRDWVINAYNTNMPFDQFTIEQLAGDMLPDATVAQRVATGFNRNHATSDEGGAIAEELRVEYVVDRVKTTATVWMGLTMECSQCHDHKYDPISQKEYYKFYAYFNNTSDPGMQTRRGNQAPVVEVVDPVRDGKIKEAEAKVSASEAGLEAHRASAQAAFQKWLDAERSKQKDKGKSPEPGGLTHWFPFDESDKNSIKDAATGGTGALVAGGKFELTNREGAGKALKLNGKTAYAFSGFPTYEADQPFTFTSWVKMPNNAGGSILSRMDVSKGHRGYDLWLQGGAVGTHIINTWSGNALKVVSNEKLKPNTWQHIAVSYDGSRKATGVKIYIDGKLAQNKVEADALKDTVVPEASVPFKIGSRSSGGNVNGEIDDLRIYNRVLTPEELEHSKGDPIGGLLSTPDDQLSDAQRDLLKNHYLTNHDPAFKKLSTEHGKLTKALADLQEKPTTSMVMQDNAEGKMRMTYLLERGHYESPDKSEELAPGIPSALPPLPADAEPNRLGLAKWLTRPGHPLTSRVAVNRYWMQLFGEGIVRTVEDFGNQGTPPTHPALLDYLAVDFEKSGWDVKRMIKKLVMSRTYRQTSRMTENLAAVDPENQLHSRGPRFRLQGEFIRDQALAVSGLLNDKIGGPGVKPYQPANIWNEVSLNGGLKYPQDTGDKLYRRSLYTYWKRSSPMPNMMIFDAPSRVKCIMRRPRTNTPLQALVTLNDPQFVEAARIFGERILREGGDSLESRFDFAFQLAAARKPTDTEVTVLKDVVAEQQYRFKDDPEAAGKFLAIGEKKSDESLDSTERAVWAVVAQMILNLDEVLTRG